MHRESEVSEGGRTHSQGHSRMQRYLSFLRNVGDTESEDASNQTLVERGGRLHAL